MTDFPFSTHQAGKRLLLITNSDYHYTNKMMNHAFNRFLPNDMGWRDLFEMVSIYVPFMLVTLTVTTCQSLLVIILETS
jgi:hypothetical protein